MGPAVSDMDLVAEGILGEFEGEPVTAVGVEISNAAGGLNEAMKANPEIHHKGDTIYVVLRCDITKVRFDPVKDEEGQCRRVHIMRATDCTVMDDPKLDKAINAQRARIQKWRDEQEKKEALFPDERLDED